MGSAPDDVKGSAELQYELDMVHGEQIRHNNQRWRARAGRLRDAGGFRTAGPRDMWERVDQPRFAGEVHQVESFKGANVEDTEGKTFPVKTVWAVPSASQDVNIGIEAGPGGGRRVRQKEMLQDYARNLNDVVPTVGLMLARVAQILRGMRGFADTADTYGLGRVGRIVSFLKLYPKLFSIQGSGPGIRVLPAAAPEPRLVPPQRGQGLRAVVVRRRRGSHALSRRTLGRRIGGFQTNRKFDSRTTRPGLAAPSGDDSKDIKRRLL